MANLMTQNENSVSQSASQTQTKSYRRKQAKPSIANKDSKQVKFGSLSENNSVIAEEDV
jgi:hypothetical protein